MAEQARHGPAEVPAVGAPESRGRRFFLYGLGVAGLAWVGALLYPVYRYLSPLPVPDPFGEEGCAKVKKVAPEDVAAPGSGANGSYGQRGCLIFRTPDGELRAVDSKCTHAGCNVEFAGDAIRCHCHGGIYDHAGLNVGGPPPRPLTRLRVFEQDGAIFVAPMESEDPA